MRRGRRSYSLASAAVAVLFLAAGAAAQSSGARAAKSSGLLVRGPFSERGLPFFGANAIPVLRGEYLVGAKAEDAASAVGAASAEGSASSAGPTTVWYTREGVVLSSAWQAIPGSANASLRLLAQPEGEVLYVRGEGYSLFVRAPKADAAARSFALALNRRFAVFFNSASSDAELSFPAVVEY